MLCISYLPEITITFVQTFQEFKPSHQTKERALFFLSMRKNFRRRLLRPSFEMIYEETINRACCWSCFDRRVGNLINKTESQSDNLTTLMSHASPREFYERTIDSVRKNQFCLFREEAISLDGSIAVNDDENDSRRAKTPNERRKNAKTRG